MEMIPFMNLSRQHALIEGEVKLAMDEVMKNTAFSGGPFVEKFEEEFAKWCGVDHCNAVNSGTDAIHLAMIAMGIGPGDEVILPANTFIATVWGPMYVGATPVFVDCDPKTWEIDPGQIEDKITDRTKLIIGVHLYGQPFDFDRVKDIADKHGIPVMEDAAQGHGAYYKGRRVGSLGEIAAFSFYPGKNLGTYGEGGGVTTSNKDLYERIQSLKNHASEQKYYHQELGFNARMGGLEGAVLSVKMQHIDQWNSRRKAIARRYQAGITNPKVVMQDQPEGTDSVYHLFVVTVDDRDKFMTFLKDNGVHTGMHYPVACHLQKATAYLGYKEGDFPNSEYLASHCVSLPMFPELTDEEQSQVIEVINKY